MKKSSLIRKANSPRTFWTKKIIFLVVSFALLLFLYLVVPVFINTAVKIAWYPFDATRIWLAESSNALPKYIRDRSVLIAELEDLKIQLATELGNNDTLNRLQNEKDSLRNLMDIVSEDRILTRVIGRPNTLPYDILMLDRGSQHGVVKDAPVFLGRDQVIGFVSKVNDKTSFVTMVTTPQFRSSAYVIGPNIYTYAEGMGGGVLRVRIPQGILLQKNDLVLLPAVDSGVYGSISHIDTSATQPEQYGFVNTNVPIQSMYYLSVGKEPIVTNNFESADELVKEVYSEVFVIDLPPGKLVTPETVSLMPATSTVEAASPDETTASEVDGSNATNTE